MVSNRSVSTVSRSSANRAARSDTADGTSPLFRQASIARTDPSAVVSATHRARESAAIRREQTGKGRVVRTSLLSSIVGVHAFQGTRVTVAGETPHAQGNHHPSIAPYGLFKCRDGAVQISVGNERLWQAFCAEFGLDAETPGLETNPVRVAHRAETIAFVEAAFADQDAEALLERLRGAGVPAGKVRDLTEVYEWEQVRSQGLVVDVDHATLGSISLPGPAIRFFDVDEAGETERARSEHTAPPLLDQHGDLIRAWLAGDVA